MNKEELEEIKNIIKYNSDYKNHYHLTTYFEVESIDNLVKCYDKQKKQLEEKDKVIKDAISYLNKVEVYEDGTEELVNLKEWWFIKELLEILERGKNEID